MKRSIVLMLAFFSLTYSYSQIIDGEKKLREAKKDTVDGWKTGGMIMLNFGQTSLTNWAAGGENTVSGNSFLNFFANYQKGNSTWDNTLDLGYGILKQGSQNRKSDDRIDFSTKYGKMASKNWYYSGLLDFRSQFTAGYNYPNDSVKISNFFAPAYITTAIGMDYKPNKTFTAFIAPVTGKITIVADQDLADAGAFGVDKAEYDIITKVKTKDGKKFRQEFGGYVRVAYQNDIMTNVNLSTKLDLFSNYLKKPQNIDLNWQVLLSMKVNKYISASFSTQLIYDYDSSPKIQFKEILGVGFSYKF